ncbi:DUF6101 family protein [Enterovirga aerilata]|uniref:Uncharacterized protein n=1 Tax=Enterovirga aerilata TaxID=2730920 RepID=A0A849IAD4_9HYPH|nr:DUF6101 family protein [Enterovirga sp. DB1703]NNM72967.1 hypothetical protein [Enterovirga sp. DB1703]
MSGYDGRAGERSSRGSGPGPRRTVCEGGSRATIIFGDTRNRLAGAVLDLTRSETDLRIVLVDGEGEAVISFGPFPEEEVIAIWRSIATKAGLAPMMRAWNGYTEPLACQLGRLRLGRVQDGRRLAVLQGRRPRFLTRRKSARLPALPLVFREREIAGGKGV